MIGEREVKCVPSTVLKEAHAKTVSASATPTLRELTDFGAGCGAQEFHGLTPNVIAGTMSAGDTMICPPGWIYYERATNNTSSAGFRACYLMPEISEQFSEMLKIAMPQDWNLVKKNTIQAFIVKVVKATREAASSDAKPLAHAIPTIEQAAAAKKVKEEASGAAAKAKATPKAKASVEAAEPTKKKTD